MRDTLLFQEIAATCGARKRCIAGGNEFEKHDARLDTIEREFLPHGSGIDNGISIDRDASTDDRTVLTFGFHNLDENGFYVGRERLLCWTDYRAVVTPAFTGYHLHITGSNRNGIKDYLHETIATALDTVSIFYCDECGHNRFVPYAGWQRSAHTDHSMNGDAK